MLVCVLFICQFKATASDFSTDIASDFIELFCKAGSKMNKGIAEVLNGERIGTEDEIKTIYGAGMSLFGIIAQPDVVPDELYNFYQLCDFAEKAVNIKKNVEGMISDTNILQETIDCYQACFDVVEILGYGSYITPGLSFAVSSIETGLKVGGVVEIAVKEESIAVYEYTLMTQYYGGMEYDLPPEDRVVIGSEITQEELDMAYYMIYLKYNIMQLADISKGLFFGQDMSYNYKITFCSNCSYIDDYSYI